MPRETGGRWTALSFQTKSNAILSGVINVGIPWCGVNMIIIKDIAHRYYWAIVGHLDGLLQSQRATFSGHSSNVAVMFICLLLFSSEQHIRSYQDAYRIVTVHTHGDFIL